MEEGWGEWVTVSPRKLKARKGAAGAKAKAEKVAAGKDKAKAAANDKAKAEKSAAAAAKVKARAVAADVKAKAAKKAAAAGGAASHPWLRFDLYTEGYPIKEQKMVKMDHRNSYIKWLLKWDKKPRDPLPNFPEELRKVTDAIKADRDENERVLADFKRDGYAYVQVDIFNDDDPRANLPDHHYDIIHHDSDEEA